MAAALPRISPATFVQGLTAVILLYAALFAVIAYKGKDTIRKMEDKLASDTVVIKRGAAAPSHHEQVPVQSTQLPAEDQAMPDKAPATPSTPVPVVLEAPKGKALQPAPVAGLYEDTDDGILPITAANGLTPFQAYKKPFAVTGKPVIALIVMDFGLSEYMAEDLIGGLPSEVSFILSPYSADSESLQQRARENGHEIWLHIPMETEGYPENDPGPQALISHGALRQNQDKMTRMLASTSGYVGIAAWTDKKFADAKPMLHNLMDSPFERGLGYFEINPESMGLIEALAITKDIPFARSHVTIGEDPMSLKALEAQAQKDKFVIAVIKPHPAQIKAIQTWVSTFEAKGLTLAPLSAVADK